MKRKGNHTWLQHIKLMDELILLSTLISTLILLVVQLAAMTVITSSMFSDLRSKAVITAAETVGFLQNPLYNVEDDQAKRIGEELLSSGRVSGITIASAVSGVILDKQNGVASRHIPVSLRDIYIEDIHLGSVELRFSDRDVIATRNMLFMITVIIVLACISANLLAYRLVILKRARKPIEGIFAGIARIADGNYDSTIAMTKFPDVNAIIVPMNEMAARIRMKNRELVELNTQLEHRVAERTAELQKSLTELHQAQDHLVASGKMTTLGYLSAGMAHELNTPLGAIIASNRLVVDFLAKKQRPLLDFLLSLDTAEQDLYDLVLELGLEKSMKLDAMVSGRNKAKGLKALLEKRGIPNSSTVAGYLVDLGIGDQVDSLGGLLATQRNAEILSWAIDPVSSRRMAEIIDLAGEKAAKVVLALRSYLSPEAENSSQVVSVENEMEKVLTLMQNLLKHGIVIHREYSGVKVNGSSDKLGQVWLNLIRNAAQAMEFKGDLYLRTQKRNGKVLVSVRDTGPGIPVAIANHIFEPFFTTKKEGEGIGLGLDICKRIVEAHHGDITFTSVPGNTEFLVTLPAFLEVSGENAEI